MSSKRSEREEFGQKENREARSGIKITYEGVNLDEFPICGALGLIWFIKASKTNYTNVQAQTFLQIINSWLFAALPQSQKPSSPQKKKSSIYISRPFFKMIYCIVILQSFPFLVSKL